MSEDLMPYGMPRPEPPASLTEEVAQLTRVPLVCTNQTEADGIGTLVNRVALLDKNIEAHYKPLKQSADKLHKDICAAESSLRAPLTEFKRNAGRVVGAWAAEERAKEEQKAREAAQLLAESDKKRVVEKAVALAAAGREDEADALMEKGASTPVVALPPRPVVVAGMRVKASFGHRVVDPAKVKTQYLIPDEAGIKLAVRRYGKDAEAIVGGIEVYEETVGIGRGR